MSCRSAENQMLDFNFFILQSAIMFFKSGNLLFTITIPVLTLVKNCMKG